MCEQHRVDELLEAVAAEAIVENVIEVALRRFAFAELIGEPREELAEVDVGDPLALGVRPRANPYEPETIRPPHGFPEAVEESTVVPPTAIVEDAPNRTPRRIDRLSIVRSAKRTAVAYDPEGRFAEIAVDELDLFPQSPGLSRLGVLDLLGPPRLAILRAFENENLGLLLSARTTPSNRGTPARARQRKASA